MADYFWRVPVAAEMNSFQAEIGGDERLVCGRKLQYRAVIPDPGYQPPASTGALGLSADLFDERFFTHGQSGININQGTKDEGRSTK